MPVDLEWIAKGAARRYCRPTGSYGVDDAAQIARVKLHLWAARTPVRDAERYAWRVAKYAILDANARCPGAHAAGGAPPLCLCDGTPRKSRPSRCGGPPVRHHYKCVGWRDDEYDAGIRDASVLRDVRTSSRNRGHLTGLDVGYVGGPDPGLKAVEDRDTVEAVQALATPFQRRVIQWLLKGYTQADAARRLGCNAMRVTRELRKLGASARERGIE